MKKLIFVFAICMAFAVKSFAYTGSTSYALYEVGSISESIIMNCQSSAGGDMGGFNPGYVEVYFYPFDGDGASPLHYRWDYPNSYYHSGSGYGSVSGSQFYWIHPIYECQVNIVVYQISNESSPLPNGVNLTWHD